MFWRSQGQSWPLNRLTFLSMRFQQESKCWRVALHISIFLYFTKLLIFSISYSNSLELRGLILLFKFTSHLRLFKQTAYGTCKFFIWEQAIEIITNLTSLLFHMLAYIHYSNNNSYQMWSVLFSSNFIIKFTQVYHFYQYFRNGSQGQWNSHHLSIFAHIYMYIWQDTLTPIWTPQITHTGILKNKVHCVNHFVF